MGNGNELLDLNFTRKDFIHKMVIFGVLAIAVIVIFSIIGIKVCEGYNKKLLSQYSEEYIIEGEENTDNVEENLEEVEQEEETRALPVYSEEAKTKMSSIYTSETEEKRAFLTFDDGPSSNITPQILQILEEEGIKATFFVLGSRVERYPELVKQEYEAGHYIANHGYSHEYSQIYSSASAVLDEYNKTESLIKQAIGNENYSSHLFRFPGGSQGGSYASVKDEAKTVLAENDVAYVNWNALTNDAVGTPTAESIIENLKETSQRKKFYSSFNA